jgi:hypothetical protein
VSLALGTVPSVWPELIRPHPYWVASLAGIGVLMVVSPLFRMLLGKGEVDNPQTVNSISSGGDNSGHQIVSYGGTVNVGHHSFVPPIDKVGTVAVASQTTEKTLSLKLVPHSENSPEVVLEVLNQGDDTVTLSAKLLIISKSTGDFKTFPFDGLWAATSTYRQVRAAGVQKFSTKTVRVESGRSENLRVVFTESESIFGTLQEMQLEGIDESILWNFDPSESDRLPSFVLQISIFGEGIKSPITKTYKVGPKAYCGPFQMIEAVA